MCLGDVPGFGGMSPSEEKTTNSTENTSKDTSFSTAGTTNNQVEVDPRLAAQANSNIDYLTSTRDQGYTPYAGNRVAPMSADEIAGTGNIRDMASRDMPPEVAMAKDNFTKYGEAPAQKISTERIVDENGPLGKISDYTSPYVNSVLRPQLEDIDEEGFRREKSNNAKATMAGAFGDTGWAFGQARDADLTRRARGSAIATANQNAWDRAMSLRGADAARFLDVDKSNAGYAEQALGRLRDAGSELEKLGFTNDQNRLAVNNALLNAGKAFRANDQASLDAAYQEFSRQTGFPLEVSQMIIAAINGSPLNRNVSQSGQTTNAGNQSEVGTKVGTQESETSKPDTTGTKLLGGLLGGFL